MYKKHNKNRYEKPIPVKKESPLPFVQSEIHPVVVQDFKDYNPGFINEPYHMNQVTPPGAIPYDSFAPVPYVPEWYDNTDYLKHLQAVKTCINDTYGYKTDADDGKLFVSTNDGPGIPGAIMAVPIASTYENGSLEVLDTSVVIVNTEDNGMRYVQTPKPGVAIDLGPVDHACIVGNVDRPEGVYVPLANAKALYDGKAIIDGALDSFKTHELETRPKRHAVVDMETLPAPSEHKCTCGGNCSCGGKCGGNCKCHKH